MTFYQFVGHTDDYVIHTYCHETGHYIDYRIRKEKDKWYSHSTGWLKAMKDDFAVSKKKSVTEYGENEPKEDFADSVAEFEVNRSRFEKEFSARAKLLKIIFKKWRHSP